MKKTAYLLLLSLPAMLFMGCEEEEQSISADFSASATAIEAGSAVSFTDASTGEVTSWQWAFPGGTPATSTDRNPEGIVYAGASIFKVTLTVTGPAGSDTKTVEGMITVTPKPCAGGLSTINYQGRDYRLAGIGDQCWFAENLSATQYRDGSDILLITDSAQWVNTTASATPAFCWFDNNPAYAAEYGALYNFYAVSDPRGLCPIGWRIATDDDFKQMKMHLGMEPVEANDSEHGEIAKVGQQLKSIHGWEAGSVAGTNTSGFTGLPSGRRGANGGFGSLTSGGYWWTSTAFSATKGWMHFLRGNRPHAANRQSEEKRGGASCRCVKD